MKKKVHFVSVLFDSYDEILFTVTCVFSAAASVGSVFVTEALQTATALTDAAYARTSERLTKKNATMEY